MDVQPGGACSLCMRSPEGVEHWRQGVYREVVEPERLVFTWISQDAEGRPGPETLVTVTFAEADGRTTLTLHQTGLDDAAQRHSRRVGWTEGLERLAEILSHKGD
jgi:uncharacterized protein YndB with AHSA1/START domain